MQDDTADELAKLKYLLNISFISNKIPDKLKSTYTLLGHTIGEKLNWSLNKEYKCKLTVCQHCYIQRNAENTLYKVAPSSRPGCSMRRIIAKSEKKKKLSTIEKKLLQKISPDNKLLLTCLVCHKVTSWKCSKRPREKIIENTPKKKAKKKAKKMMEKMTLLDSLTKAAKKTANTAVNSTATQPLVSTNSLPSSAAQDMDCEIICEGIKYKNEPLQQVPPCNNKPVASSEEIITLDTSLPNLVAKKPKQKSILVNPYAKNNKLTLALTVRNKKMSALQQLVEKEQKGKLNSSSPRLKDFLNVL